jgi:uncharacterized protein
MIRKTLLVLTVIAALSLDALAQPTVDAGFRAYQAQDYPVALSNLRPLAEDGDAYAQYVLGVMYAMGQGVTRNDDIAIVLYRKSANQGNADAQFAMGKMYKNARGVTRDYEQAVGWFKKAQKQGHKKAKAALDGLCESRTWVCQ